MKIYTKEQVIDFTMSMISQYEFGNKNIRNRESLKESLDCKTPIELPSDEEIEKNADINTVNINEHIVFIIGVKWAIRQILNQNK